MVVSKIFLSGFYKVINVIVIDIKLVLNTCQLL